MMVCMAGLQVFIVRFFFQVCHVQPLGMLKHRTDNCFRAQERVTYEKRWFLRISGKVIQDGSASMYYIMSLVSYSMY